MSIESLKATLTQFIDQTTRIRVVFKAQTCAKELELSGYVRYVNDPIKYSSYVVLAVRRNKYGGLDGYRRVYLDDIVRIEETKKKRRTKTYARLWARNPFVMTPDGTLDMTSSLKTVLGIA